MKARTYLESERLMQQFQRRKASNPVDRLHSFRDKFEDICNEIPYFKDEVINIIKVETLSYVDDRDRHAHSSLDVGNQYHKN